MRRCSVCGALHEGDFCTQCAARRTTQPVPPPEPEILLQPGQRFHGLEIVRLLGRGGMGVVYQARQPALDRFVALKLLPQKLAFDLEFQNRFAREAKALAALSHPSIVAVYDFGVEENQYFLVMEFVDGADLRRVLRERRLTADEALKIVPQLCDALEYAHAEGVVHRDIKPENILIDKKGRVKIADFGLAKMLGVDAGLAALTQTDVVVGTPHYMAPEQLLNSKSVDHRADIYSMGVVFYEMLTGDLPLGLFAPPSKTALTDTRLDSVVLKALEKEPDRRYQHASEVRTDVAAIAATGPAPRRPSKLWIVPLAVTAGVVALVVVLWGRLHRRPPEPPAPPVAEEPVDFESVHFMESETPAGHRWVECGDIVPRNPFSAKDPDEIDKLLCYMDGIPLRNVARTDVKRGYFAGWWGVGMVALECTIAERLERDFMATQLIWNRWAYRRGPFLVVVFAAKRMYRRAFADLVRQIRVKLKLPEESPDLPIENARFDPDEIPSPWEAAESYGDLPMPFVEKDPARLLDKLKSIVQIEPGDVRRAVCAAFRRPGAFPTIAEVVVEFQHADRAREVAGRAAARPGGSVRKLEVLQAGRTVAFLLLHSGDWGGFERFARTLRSWMGVRSCSMATLKPTLEELPEGLSFERVEESVGKVLEEAQLSDVGATSIARAYRARFLPEGSILLIECSDITARPAVEAKLEGSGAVWSDDRWICAVQGPEALRKLMRQKFDKEP